MSFADWTIRPADARDWAAIERLLVDRALPTEGAREHLATFLLAERGGELAGLVGLEAYGRQGLLRSLSVRVGLEKRGVATSLLGRVLALARERGVEHLYLLTTTAAAYFPRFGFEAVPWSSLPEVLRSSAELQGACPTSATAMHLRL